MTTLSKNKVILGLSGGVDSTAAALLLAEKGFEITGFYFDVLGTNLAGQKAARDLAEKLGIEFLSADVSEAFDAKIITNFCKAYSSGRTPNPCVICNPMIKFKKLIEIADEKGAFYIATGHYARILHDEITGISYIRKGANLKKDQSYMLYRLGRDVLRRLILPLGDIEDKEITREMARSYKMPNAETSDSQEICFIDEERENYISFMERKGYLCQKGDFVSSDGEVLGKHRGISHYTVGQRKGLGIALGKPAFVTAINPEKNQVVLGDNQDLFKDKVIAGEVFFTETSSEKVPARLLEKRGITAKIRYAAKPAEVLLEDLGNGRICANFSEPQRAPAPGQSVVFYEDDCVIGGGFIE